LPTVKVNGVTLYYEVHGDGCPLVLIAGYGGSSEHWLPEEIRALQAAFKVIVFDNRGTGRSSPSDEAYSIATMADDAAALLDAVNLTPAHVLGVSMGGMVAQEVAINHPETVNKLILCSTTAGGPHSVRFRDALAFAETIVQWDRSTEDLLDWIWSRLYTTRYVQAHRDRLIDDAASIRFPTPPHTYRRQLHATSAFDSYTRLGRIKASTLVMTGAADALIAPDNSRILADRIPRATLQVFDDVGHMFFREVWGHTLREITRFT
jgi:pimeloyl-ACP methyl ester carboxylesterase